VAVCRKSSIGNDELRDGTAAWSIQWRKRVQKSELKLQTSPG
jgi:hypothetical protein